jgi:hypothetical protein
MLSCKESTRLLSEGQDRKLTLSEKVQLEMHLTLCKGCKNFKSQMSFLRTACQCYVKQHSSQQDEERGG